MNLAVVSLGALVLTITLSCTTGVNAGFLSIVLSWVIGVWLGGMSTGEVIAGFPSQLFLTLVGVTLLFTLAQVNGTLDRVAHRAVISCRGKVAAIPLMFFLLTFVLSSIGPGNIASAALMAPLAMAVAGEVGVPLFLMAIMVGNGANAGALSPFAPTGIIVGETMDKLGLGGHELRTYLNNVMAHTVVAGSGYLLFGGLQLFGRSHTDGVTSTPRTLGGEAAGRFEARHFATLAAIASVVVVVIGFGVNVGLMAFAASCVLVLGRMADEGEAVRRIPWRVIMMVTGVTVLISIMEKTGGMDLFISVLAAVATKELVTGTIAFFTGLISIYSSTSGVVLPAMLPTVPGLAERFGVDALAIASSMNVGGHLVDVSPLSTIGALCLAAVPAAEHRALFNKLMAWGLSMAVVGAIVCWLLF